MREIKFRAWDNYLNEMVYAGNESIFGYHKNCGHKIMQFTGLHDKNGKEIYEGDIVTYTYDKDFNVVVYSEIIPAFVTKDINGCEYLPSIEDYNSWVVIGNIHENPELIK